MAERADGNAEQKEKRSSGQAAAVRELLAARGLSPNKRFGQNFLIDRTVLSRIVEAAALRETDTVLEIGPGAGALTERLAEKAGRVVAVEIDRGLATLLGEEFAGNPRVKIVRGDILKTDLTTLFAEEITAARAAGGGTVKVVANLPYYITTPILMALLPRAELFSGFIVMMQREVAERMQARPGSKDYGALSLSVQYYAAPEIVTLVPPGAFYPQPEVTSAVLRLERRITPPVQVSDPDRMFAIIAAAFGRRRKTLVNAIAGAPQLGIDAGRLREALAKQELPPNVRGEALTLADYAALSEML